MNCKYNHDEFCVNDQCPMCGDYCPVPDNEGVCKYEEHEDRYILTPKGCLEAAMFYTGISIRHNELDALWGYFSTLMKQFGYVEEEQYGTSEPI